jgi:hypothetical protein
LRTVKKLKTSRRRKVVAAGALLLGALVAALTVLAGSASASDPAPSTDVKLRQEAVLADCGEVTLRFHNVTPYLFVMGVNVIGSDVIERVVVDGRVVDGPDVAELTLTFDERTTVTYGTIEGAESDWYLPFETIVVEACETETTTTTTTTTATTTTTTATTSSDATTTTTSVPPKNTSGQPSTYTRPVTVHPTNVHTVTTSDRRIVGAVGASGSSGSLPDTGVSGTVKLVWLGGLLVLAGGATIGLLLLRRRDARPNARR